MSPTTLVLVNFERLIAFRQTKITAYEFLWPRTLALLDEITNSPYGKSARCGIHGEKAHAFNDNLEQAIGAHL